MTGFFNIMISFFGVRSTLPTADIPVLKTIEACDAALSRELVIMFKHSLSCPVSGMAKGEIASFRDAHPDAPVFMLHAQRRELAQYIAAVTGVAHASPQVLVIRSGKVVGTLSHFRITFDSLIELVKS